MAPIHTQHLGQRHRPARPQLRAVNPAGIRKWPGITKTAHPDRPRNPTEALNMLPKSTSTFVPPENPYNVLGNPSAWVGAPPYSLEHAKKELGYREGGVKLEPTSLTYVPEPLEPLFGLEYHLRPLQPAPPMPLRRGSAPSREEILRRFSRPEKLHFDMIQLRLQRERDPVRRNNLIERIRRMILAKKPNSPRQTTKSQ